LIRGKGRKDTEFYTGTTSIPCRGEREEASIIYILYDGSMAIRGVGEKIPLLKGSLCYHVFTKKLENFLAINSGREVPKTIFVLRWPSLPPGRKMGRPPPRFFENLYFWGIISYAQPVLR